MWHNLIRQYKFIFKLRVFPLPTNSVSRALGTALGVKRVKSLWSLIALTCNKALTPWDIYNPSPRFMPSVYSSDTTNPVLLPLRHRLLAHHCMPIFRASAAPHFLFGIGILAGPPARLAHDAVDRWLQANPNIASRDHHANVN